MQNFSNQVLQSYFTFEKLQLPKAFCYASKSLSHQRNMFAGKNGVHDFHIDVF